MRRNRCSSIVLIAAGMPEDEAKVVIYAVVQEVVRIAEAHSDSIPAGQRLRQTEETIVMVAKRVSEDRNYKTRDGDTRGKDSTWLRDLLIGVLGNAAFYGICKAVEYLSDHGWILHCPDPHVEHVMSILEMPDDEMFFARLPPSRAQLKQLCEGRGAIISLSKGPDSYIAKVVTGGMGDTARLLETLSDQELNRLTETAISCAANAGITVVGLFYLGVAANFYAPWWNNGR